MARTLTQRIVDAMPLLDEISEKVQPVVQDAVRAGGVGVRNALDGVWFEAPLHPVVSDLPIGSWTAAATFDALDLATGSKAMRNAADATLALGVAGGFAAAAIGLSDWRHTSGEARRMGMAHALFNSAGLALSTASLVLRATGRRGAGRLALLAGYSCTGMGAHLGGELSYKYGLRVNRDAFEPTGPEDFLPVLDAEALGGTGVRRVDARGAGVLLSRIAGGEVGAVSATCNQCGAPLESGAREGETVVCPHCASRFDLRDGAAIDGPAVFPLSTYRTRVRGGRIEVRESAENVQRRAPRGGP